MEAVTEKMTPEEFIKQRGGIYLPEAKADDSEEQPAPDDPPISLPPMPLNVKKTGILSVKIPLLPLFILAAALFAAAGALLYGGLLGTIPAETVSDYLRLRVDGGFFENATASFFGALIWTAIPFFAGFCAVGHPVALLVLPLKGLGTGMAAAYFITAFGADGAAAAAILLAPSAIFGTLAAAYQCRLSLSASSRLFSYIRGRAKEIRPSAYFGRYFVRSLFCGFCCFGVGLFDAVISLLCADMFIIR